MEEIITSEEEDRVNKESYKYKYDSDGNEIERAYYNAENELLEKRILTYDSNGNRIKLAIYNSNGSIIQKFASTYDVNGNLLREENDSDVFEITYVYR